MTARRRAGGRAPAPPRPWLWVSGAIVCLWLGFVGVGRELPYVGVVVCFLAAVACSYWAGVCTATRRNTPMN